MCYRDPDTGQWRWMRDVRSDIANGPSLLAKLRNPELFDKNDPRPEMWGLDRGKSP